MENLIIYGAGGLAAEVVQLVEDINASASGPLWNLAGCIDDYKGRCGRKVCGVDIIGTYRVLEAAREPVNVVIAVGDPDAREKIYNNIKNFKVKFPAIIHPAAKICKGAVIGEGSIIAVGSIVSVNAVVGRQVFLNMRSQSVHHNPHTFSSILLCTSG